MILSDRSTIPPVAIVIFQLKFALFWKILKTWDGRTTCVKIVITRDFGSAAWIKSQG